MKRFSRCANQLCSFKAVSVAHKAEKVKFIGSDS